MAQTTCGVTCVTRDLGRVTCCNDLRNIALAIGCLFVFFGRRGYHFFFRIAWSSGDESFTITVATAVHLLLFMCSKGVPLQGGPPPQNGGHYAIFSY